MVKNHQMATQKSTMQHACKNFFKNLPKTMALKYNVTMSPHFCHIPLPLNFKTLKGFLPPKFHSTIPCHLPYSTLPYHVAIVILLLLLG
jgi:hypothetical protein